MNRMKDDEKQLLAHCQAGKAPASLEGMGHGRMVQLLKKWQALGWYCEAEGKLTDRGMTVTCDQAGTPSPPDLPGESTDKVEAPAADAAAADPVEPQDEADDTGDTDEVADGDAEPEPEPAPDGEGEADPEATPPA